MPGDRDSRLLTLRHATSKVRKGYQAAATVALYIG